MDTSEQAILDATPPLGVLGVPTVVNCGIIRFAGPPQFRLSLPG